MDIRQYYQRATEIGNLPELAGTADSNSILSALDYNRLDDHPSNWVPNVQEALLQCFTDFPSETFSQGILELYIQGSIMEEKADRNISVKVGFSCLMLGLFVGWLVWS